MFRKGVTRKDVFAWANLDFANSGYTTVVLTAVFNSYFVTTVMQGSFDATFIWTIILSISYFIVMISAPIIGAYADCKNFHKPILIVSSIACVTSIIFLGFSKEGTVLFTAIFLVISNISYSIHQDVSAAYLVSFAEDESLGRVSGFGWSWGYVGGLLSLLICLLWISTLTNYYPKASINLTVMGTMIITALLFFVSSFYALINLKKLNVINVDPYWKRAWSRFFSNIKSSANNKDLFNFFICIFFYHAGIAAVITIAAIYAKEVMLFNIKQTIFLIIVVNVTASVGAIIFGILQDKVGHKSSIRVILLLWCCMILLLYLSDSLVLFWVAANFAGLAMGASQSGARAAIAYMSPLNKQAENFGIWGFFINAAAMIGPPVYGFVTLVTQNNHKIAILTVGIFFLMALIQLERCKFTKRIQS